MSEFADKNYADVKLGNPIDHTNKGRRQADFMQGLEAEYVRYKAEILPQHPDNRESSSGQQTDYQFQEYDDAKNEFLESLWDVISQYFEDIGKQ